jgi:hypothetical protein
LAQANDIIIQAAPACYARVVVDRVTRSLRQVPAVLDTAVKATNLKSVLVISATKRDVMRVGKSLFFVLEIRGKLQTLWEGVHYTSKYDI